MRRGTARREPKTAESGTTDSGVHKRSAYMEHRGGHRESARSGDADDGEGVGKGAEVDNALPRRRQLVRSLVLDLGRLGLLELDASLGLVLLVLDLERAELVVPSKAAVVLQKGGGGVEHTCPLALWAEVGRRGRDTGLHGTVGSPDHLGPLA